MALRHKRAVPRALPILVLIAYLSTLALASGEWQTFSSENEFLKGQYMDDAPSKYEFRDCEFNVPGSVDFSNSRQQRQQDIRPDPSGRLRDAFQAAQTIAASTAQAVEALNLAFQVSSKVLTAIPVVGTVLASVFSIAASLVNASQEDPVVGMIRQLREEFDEQLRDTRDYATHLVLDSNTQRLMDAFAFFESSYKECYNQDLDTTGFLQCARSLEALYADTAIFFPSQHHTVQFSRVFPISITFASMYFPIAADYLAGLLYWQENQCKINEATCAQAYSERKREVPRIMKKIDAITTALQDRMLVETLQELFPVPFTSNPAVVQAYDHSERVRVIEEFAKIAKEGIVSKNAQLDVTALRQFHNYKQKNYESYPASGSVTYSDGRYYFVHLDLARRYIGSEKSTATYTFSRDATCTVQGEQVSGYRSGGSACHPSSFSFYPSCHWVSERYPLRYSTSIIMQALVEQYYARGAAWTKAYMIDPVTSVVGTLRKFRRKLDESMLEFKGGREYITFTQGFPSGAIHKNVDLVRDGKTRAVIKKNGLLEVRFNLDTECQNLQGRTISLTYIAPSGGYLNIRSHKSRGTDKQDAKQCTKLEQQFARFKIPPSKKERTISYALKEAEGLSPGLVFGVSLQGIRGKEDPMSVTAIEIGSSEGQRTSKPEPVDSQKFPILVSDFGRGKLPEGSAVEGNAYFSGNSIILDEGASVTFAYGRCVNTGAYNVEIRYKADTAPDFGHVRLITPDVKNQRKCGGIDEKSVPVGLQEHLSLDEDKDQVAFLRWQSFGGNKFFANGIEINGPIQVYHIRLVPCGFVARR